MNDSIFIEPVDSLEIENLLIGKKKKIFFFDQGITNHILIKSAVFITEHFSIIFNKCFEIGIFPTYIPIFKSGDKKYIANYRLIILSLLIC